MLLYVWDAQQHAGLSTLCQPSEHPAAREGLNFIPQLQSPISLFPVNDIIAYIKPLRHVSFICLISNSEHTSWKLCLIVKLKTFGFPLLAEICSEHTSYLVEFLSNHFYTAIESARKQKGLYCRIKSHQFRRVTHHIFHFLRNRAKIPSDPTRYQAGLVLFQERPALAEREPAHPACSVQAGGGLP